MRPKLFTLRNLILILLVIGGFAAFIVWQLGGGKVGLVRNIPSTAGKIAWVKDGAEIYMADGATGANAVLLTTDKKGADAEPAWSPDGETLALSSDRNGIVRQLYVMEATPGATVGVRTNSSATKEAPHWGTEGDIYFLDAGRISRLLPKTGNIDAKFPSAEQKRKYLADLFSSGGITRFVVSADGSRFWAAVRREQGEALVVYLPQENAVAVFGIGEKVLFSFAPDGESVYAVIVRGEPFPNPEQPGAFKPMPILTPQIVEASESNPQFVLPTLPPYAESDVSVLIKISPNLEVTPIIPFPFAPTGLAVTSDDTGVIVSSTDKKTPGVFRVALDGGADRLAAVPATEPALSLDGSKVAFVSGADIYVVEAKPGTATPKPVNLTNGAGTNTMPTWSPAKPRK